MQIDDSIYSYKLWESGTNNLQLHPKATTSFLNKNNIFLELKIVSMEGLQRSLKLK